MNNFANLRVGLFGIGLAAWEITATRIHIRGYALIFASISEQQDEETSDYKSAPPSLTLADAAKMLKDGRVAKSSKYPIRSRGINILRLYPSNPFCPAIPERCRFS
jgi:hypothetical protein